MKRIDLENGMRILSQIELPAEFKIRLFEKEDFQEIQHLYQIEGWVTIINRPEEALSAWTHSSPALVLLEGEKIIGVVRGLTDTEITTYIVELLIDEDYRGRGFGRSLIEACHLLYPHTRIEVLATHFSQNFYTSTGFRPFYGFRKSYY